MATITFNQAGLSPAGITNRSRSDGLIDGSEVTITLDQPGFVSFVDVPEGDVDSTSSLTQTGPSVWKYTPTAGVFGSWLVEAQPFAPDTKPVRRVFAVRSPEKGLRVPAFNERASSQATATTGVSFVDESDDNEGGTYRGWARSLAELFRTVANGLFTANKVQESGGPATLNVSTIPASGVLRRNSTSQIVGGPVLVDNAGNITGAGTINGITPSALTNTAPVAVSGNSAIVGVATDAARSDHRHLVVAGTPVALAIGGSNAAGTSASLARADHLHGMPGLATTSVDGFMPATSATKLAGISDGADVTLTALSTAAVDIAVNNRKITGLANPTNALDAATKGYADAVTQGLDVKPSCRVIATGNLTLSGTQTIDGVAVAAGNRVLCAGQTAGATNGIYVVATGAWTRAADADTSADVSSGMFTFVVEGTSNADSGWVLITLDPIVLDTTPLVFTQFSGAGQVQAGTGLTKAGNTLNIGANADGSIVVAADDLKVGVLATDAQHGTRGGGTQHAAVTTSVDGFMAATDKVKLDGIATGAAALTVAGTPTQISVTTATVGSGTAAAKSDHTHSVSTATPISLSVGGTNAPGTATSLVRSDHTHGLPAFGTAAGTFCEGNDARLITPALHATRHQDGGADEINVAGLSGLLADPQRVTLAQDGSIKGTRSKIDMLGGAGIGVSIADNSGANQLDVSVTANFGTTGNTVCQGNDARLIVNPATNGFRLSVSATNPLSPSPGGTYTTIYLTPYDGDCIALNNGTSWGLFQTSGAEIGMSGLVTDRPADIFAFSSGGAVTLERLNWTNATTRATGIVRQNGVWVKSGDVTRRYIGTIVGWTATSIIHNNLRCAIWNVSNRVDWTFAESWPGGSNNPASIGVWQQLGAGFDYVCGVAEDWLSATVVGVCDLENASVAVALGLDGLVPTGIRQNIYTSTLNTFLALSAFSRFQNIGFHRIAGLIFSTNISAKFVGQDAVNVPGLECRHRY